MKSRFSSSSDKAILVIFALAGALLVFGFIDKSFLSEKKVDRSKMQAAVNRHLLKTAEQLEMQKKRMQIESTKLNMTYLESKADQAYQPPKEGVNLIENQNSESVASDLTETAAKGLTSNPMELIQHDLFVEEQRQKLSENYKKEYARQFIENARRGGYDIKLNDDFKIISVKPIRKPTQSF